MVTQGPTLTSVFVTLVTVAAAAVAKPLRDVFKGRKTQFGVCFRDVGLWSLCLLSTVAYGPEHPDIEKPQKKKGAHPVVKGGREAEEASGEHPGDLLSPPQSIQP